jgi:hypothetical protein
MVAYLCQYCNLLWCMSIFIVVCYSVLIPWFRIIQLWIQCLMIYNIIPSNFFYFFSTSPVYYYMYFFLKSHWKNVNPKSSYRASSCQNQRLSFRRNGCLREIHLDISIHCGVGRVLMSIMPIALSVERNLDVTIVVS